MLSRRCFVKHGCSDTEFGVVKGVDRVARADEFDPCRALATFDEHDQIAHRPLNLDGWVRAVGDQRFTFVGGQNHPDRGLSDEHLGHALDDLPQLVLAARSTNPGFMTE